MSRSRHVLTLAAAAASLVASALVAAGAGTPSAPADAPDIPVAMDVSATNDVFLAMRADVADHGGLARVAWDCAPITTWRTADVVDVAVGRGRELSSVWSLEEWPESTQGDRRVRQYSTTGVPRGWFPVLSSARYIQSVSLGRDDGSELYVAHLATDDRSAQMTVHGENGALRRAWDLPGEPRGLAVAGGSAENRPVYVAIVGQADGAGGRLIRYGYAGGVVWEKPLDMAPASVSIWGAAVVVAGRPLDATNGVGQILYVGDDAVVLRSWPLADFVPLDVVRAGYDVMLGHPPGEPDNISLRGYANDGTLQVSCTRFPQLSVPTPEGTVACPAPTPGVEAWRYWAAGNVAAAPAIDGDGTAYLATKRALLYAVDCTGRRKWLFDYSAEIADVGPQAFEGAPAVDESGIVYVGDDILAPNYFFAIQPDGRTKWVQQYYGPYSQIDASPALAPDGHIFAASRGWAATVTGGAILVLHRDGRLVRPADGDLIEKGVGPIAASPVLLADGSAAYLSPPFNEWVFPTGTPPTVTPVAPRPTRTPTGTLTPPTAATSATAATPSPLPSGTVAPLPYRAFLPHLAAGAAVTTGTLSRRPAVPAQELPPPAVTQPVPARLRLVRAGVLPDLVADLPGLSAPSSPATDGRDVWFTALANDGAHLLAYRAGERPELRLDWNLDAPAAASPVLGRQNPTTGLLELLLMGTDGRLLCLDVSADTGVVRERWSRYVGEPAAGAPVLGDDGRVYVAAGQVAQALDRVTGEVVWSLALDSPASGSVNLAAGGMLYVATQTGEVLAIGTGAGGLDPEAAWPAFRHDARNTGAGKVGP